MYKIDYPQYVIRYRFTPVHFLLAFFAFLATLTTASPLRALDPLPQVNGTPFGAIPGSFGVDESGSSIYNIPLRVAPGTRGIEPQLSLNYNSASANTLIAVGWSLGGLSAVTRCPSTVAQDGQAYVLFFEYEGCVCLFFVIVRML